MEKYFDINESGFSIRCKLYYNKDLHKLPHIVVATYGFGGNKDNKAIEKFAERLTTKYHGYGVVCFDWPCHGKDARNKLILDECCGRLFRGMAIFADAVGDEVIVRAGQPV